ncbi:response regulator transcription factor [bacterium]|nr:response regulator transcription factor [bacterium]
MNDAIRLAIVEDESLFRELLCTALSTQPSLAVAAAFGDAAQALAELPDIAPDVVILDLELGRGANGFQVGLSLRRYLPKVGVVLLSNHRDPSLLTMLPPEQAHGWAYLLKSSVRDVAALERAVHSALSGLVILDPQLTQDAQESREATSLRDQLTSRGYDLIQLIAEGHSNQAIANRLHLTEKTVENQIGTLYRKLGISTSDSQVHPRVQAALKFIEALSP